MQLDRCHALGLKLTVKLGALEHLHFPDEDIMEWVD